MASIFTYQEEPPRVHSPWSTPGHTTPRLEPVTSNQNGFEGSYITSITKLEPERQDGPTEYKLHLLLRNRYKNPTPASIGGSSPISGARSLSSEALLRSANELAASPTLHPRTSQSRQVRLQQLTTQLLWRLQQSSPFHSSSNAALVLPVLPEATPRLGVPERPARLLPGLEESQGALYEIGVADDGTLEGLIEDELEESLNNLRAMAASLGCVVDVLRRVLVGQHGAELQAHSAQPVVPKLWVAEVLVRPEGGSSRNPPLEGLGITSVSTVKGDETFEKYSSDGSRVEQMRVAIVGASTTGKSSLVGTLTTSILDNGRGKSRLSLLKHRHEITSGITSSVAQELIGYSGEELKETKVINYASGDVSSWPDIHNLSRRLVFLSDSPGLPRYAKSALRTLVSWDPHWTLFCVPADAEQNLQYATTPTSPTVSNISGAVNGTPEVADVSLVHLDVCLKLHLQLVVVVTKMDIATKTDLKTTLAKVLSALKSAGRKPVLLSAPSDSAETLDEGHDIVAQLSRITSAERAQLQSLLHTIAYDPAESEKIVPIVLTSSVTGTGFGKVHSLLKNLPAVSTQRWNRTDAAACNKRTASHFHVDEIFAIPPSKVYQADHASHPADHGIVVCGHVAEGCLSVGDRLRLGPFWLDTDTCTGTNVSDSPRHVLLSIEAARRPGLPTMPGDFSKSLQGDKITVAEGFGDVSFAYVDVQVVSLRSLRLPVRRMEQGETGTVGIQSLDQTSPIPLGRARKGMILSSCEPDGLFGHKSFAAAFAATDFTGTHTPPLVLGGHATVYTNSIRAAVRVASLDFDEKGFTDPSSPVEMFSFDGEAAEHLVVSNREIRITFKFVSSIEWVEAGRLVLVVPHAFAAGPVTGPPSHAITGLSGFVGTVSETFT